MRKSVVAWLACMLLASSPVVAADVATPRPALVEAFSYRFYVEARAGVPLQQDYDITIGPLGAATYRADTGWHAAVAGGIQFSPNWRAELHFSYSNAQDGRVRLGGVNIPHRGNVNVYTFTVDGFYTFTQLSPWVQPFIGAAVGAAVYELDRHGAVGGAFVSHGSDTTHVLALHAGLDFPLGRFVTLTARYTLAHTGEVSFKSIPAGVTTTRDSAIDHIFSGGLRVYFN